MKVAQVIEPGKLAIVEQPFPSDPETGEIIVKMKAAGICGSDVHVYHGRSAFATYPRIIGHELAGEVYKVGSGVTNVRVGDRVAIDPVNSCGECYACKIGRPNVCRNIKVLAAHIDGGFREYFKINSRNAYKIPEEISWEFAATIEPFSIAAEATDRGSVRSDDTVLICGAGPIGLAILQALKRFGVKVSIMDIVDSRLEKALRMGADLAINSLKIDLEQAVMNFTSGEGVNLIFEATGNIGIVEKCISKLSSQASRIVILGFSSEPAKIAPLDIMRKELDIRGSRLNKHKFPEVIEWLKNKEIDPSKIISHEFSFGDIQNAFDLIDKSPEEVCKVILKF
jgi:L-gulonate 5-dehydrogenase